MYVINYSSYNLFFLITISWKSAWRNTPLYNTKVHIKNISFNHFKRYSGKPGIQSISFRLFPATNFPPVMKIPLKFMRSANRETEIFHRSLYSQRWTWNGVRKTVEIHAINEPKNRTGTRIYGHLFIFNVSRNSTANPPFRDFNTTLRYPADFANYVLNVRVVLFIRPFDCFA